MSKFKAGETVDITNMTPFRRKWYEKLWNWLLRRDPKSYNGTYRVISVSEDSYTMEIEPREKK